MQICYDNLEKLSYTKRKGIWRDAQTGNYYVFRERCENCAEPYLAQKHQIGNSCCQLCSRYVIDNQYECPPSINRELENKLKNLNTFELGYLCGMIDGEGSIYIHKEKNNYSRGFSYRPGMKITSTDIKVLRRIINLIGGYLDEGNKKGNRKKCWNVRWGPNATRQILPKICNLLIIKRKHAKITIEFLTLLKSGVSDKCRPEEDIQRREKLYFRLRKLNKRGTK